MKFKIEIEDGVGNGITMTIGDPNVLVIHGHGEDGSIEMSRAQWKIMRDKVDAMFNTVDKKIALFSSKE
jgi:hypothetical protein